MENLKEKNYIVGDTTRKILKCYQSQNIFF
jgi:hypothetical protein